MLQGDRGVDLQVAVDVEQFSGAQRAPFGIVVHGFAGYHDRGGGCQRSGADADSAGGAGLVEVAVSVRTAGAAVQDE
jgi:hypothetical protein